jgi:hypothetical protein
VVTSIREVPGANLAPETGYRELDFSWFFTVPPDECRDSTLKLGDEHFAPDPFQSTYHPIIRRYIILVTEKAS